MLILPAIDLLDGRCVRLRQGRFEEPTIYSEDPVEVARGFVERGARALHVVDLDGARTGSARNLGWIDRIREEVPVTLQVGGGIRDGAMAVHLLDGGIDRIVLGTAAVENSGLLRELLAKYPPDRVAAGLDVREGKLAVRGWQHESNRRLTEVLNDLEDLGLRRLVCTDVTRDGILVGPSHELAASMVRAGFDVTIAGGIATADDIRHIRRSGAAACIIGSALYTGMLSLSEALEAARAD